MFFKEARTALKTNKTLSVVPPFVGFLSTNSLVHMNKTLFLFFHSTAFGIHLPPVWNLACAATTQYKKKKLGVEKLQCGINLPGVTLSCVVDSLEAVTE